MRCKNCNTELPPKAQFCVNCGQKVEEEVVQTANQVRQDNVKNKKTNKKIFPKVIFGIVAGILLLCIGGKVVATVMENNKVECSISLDENVDISKKIQNQDLLLALISGLPVENVIFDRDKYLANIEEYENNDSSSKYFAEHFETEKLYYTWKEEERTDGYYYHNQHEFPGFQDLEDYDDEVTIKNGQIVELSVWMLADKRVEKQAKKLYKYLSSAQRVEAFEGKGVCGYRDGYYYEYQEYLREYSLNEGDHIKLVQLKITKKDTSEE